MELTPLWRRYAKNIRTSHSLFRHTAGRKRIDDNGLPGPYIANNPFLLGIPDGHTW